MSTSALPAPPIGYGGLEWIAYNSAVELAKLGQDVTLITTNESTKLGVSDAIGPDEKPIGKLTVASAGPTSWNYTGERDMFLNCWQFLVKEFGEGQGVIIDHSWWAYCYYLLTGGEIVIDAQRSVNIPANPKMKMMHVIHGVTTWQKRPSGEYQTPPGVQYPRIMGVSRTHAAYLSNCFKVPTRYVFNGVEIPDNCQLENVGSPAPENGSQGAYFLSLNRISREKGIHNVIDVCVATKTPLKVVGDDTHVADQKYVFDIMDQCARSGGIAEYVGGVDNDAKWTYLRGCRGLICCPDTSNYVESFYMAAVEGWSLGKPILALANGGLADTVIDGLNGFIANNPGEMKEILVRGKAVYRPYAMVESSEGKSVQTYIQAYMGMMNFDAELIKKEAQKYTIEKMAEGYLQICKGIMDNDPSYNW